MNKDITIETLVQEAHKTAKEHGWWERGRSFPECIALMHSELSEALEAWRDSEAPFYFASHGGKPEGWLVELADVLIRVGDWVGSLGDGGALFDEAIRAKLEFNKTRTWRHGNKRA